VIQEINELEVLQVRLDYYIPKKEITDAIQHTMERS